MITKEEARTRAIAYLHLRNRNYHEVDNENQIAFNAKKQIIYGEKKDELVDTYSVGYAVPALVDFDLHFITIDAHTGEVLYSISSTRWVEAYE